MKKILVLITAIGTVYVSHASQVSPVPADGANTSAQASWLSQMAQDPRVQSAIQAAAVSLLGTGAGNAAAAQSGQQAVMNDSVAGRANGQGKNGIISAVSAWLDPEDGATGEGSALVGAERGNMSLLNQQQPMQTRSFEQQQVGLQGQGGLWQAVQDWWNGRSTTTPSSVNTSSRWNSSSWYKPSSR
ncbi:MAG: hypothetical protein NT124_00385 [Candidatus Dependentiae bacterium]|nr:hypothetical protein [Candidatus Dependentiae bacterium]